MKLSASLLAALAVSASAYNMPSRSTLRSMSVKTVSGPVASGGRSSTSSTIKMEGKALFSVITMDASNIANVLIHFLNYPRFRTVQRHQIVV